MSDYSDTGKLDLFPYDTRFRPIAPPDTGIFDEPRVSVCLNVKWAAHIDGALERLLWPDAWLGTLETKQWAVAQITMLLVSLMARNPCGGEDMPCCDDLIERLEAIEAAILTLNQPTPAQVAEQIGGISDAYQDYIENTESVYQDDITNVHPEMAYGDANDPIRDQALCFMTRRFVDICCEWVIKNIEWKQGNQQTVLNIASFLGTVSGAAARFFAETAFGAMFQNIETVLDLEVQALTIWVTSVTESQLAIFQDSEARDAVACGWYNELKGETPTQASFVSSLNAVTLTGNAAVIRDKLAAALTPVNVPQQPDGERLFFIWADLWAEAYTGAQAGIVPDCLCEEPSLWVMVSGAGEVEKLSGGSGGNGTYTFRFISGVMPSGENHIWARWADSTKQFTLNSIAIDVEGGLNFQTGAGTLGTYLPGTIAAPGNTHEKITFTYPVVGDEYGGFWAATYAAYPFEFTVQLTVSDIP
jgi:hypothetical protein